MFIRGTILFVLFCSVAQAQIEKFEGPHITKWALIARNLTDHSEFELTATQYQRIKVADIEFQTSVIAPGSTERTLLENESKCKEYLAEVTGTLNQKQQQRFRQVAFQVWMNRENLRVPLEAFVPEAIEGLEEKLAALNAEVNEKRQRVTESLDTREYSGIVGRSQKDKDRLLDFLAWRWQRQREWLQRELGQERVAELLGKPFPITYHYVMQGDIVRYRRTVEGQSPYGGQLFSPIKKGSITYGNGVRVKYLEVRGFDPATGKLVTESKSKSPADVPSGLTLDIAKQQLEKAETDYYELLIDLGEFSEKLRELQAGGHRDPRIEVAEKVKAAKLSYLKIEKARRVVEELGGDPDERRKAIVAAGQRFSGGFVACNTVRFLSHFKPNAKQCAALEDLAKKHQGDIKRFQAYWGLATGKGTPAATHAEMQNYYSEVHKILSPTQGVRFKQFLFSRYWFSKRCAQAFELTKIELTEEQQQKVAKLTEVFEGGPRTNTEIDGIRFLQYLKLPDLHRYVGSKRHSLLVQRAEKFERVLEEIVGRETAANLLGEPAVYDRTWKRPVEIPDGMTLAKAKARLKALGDAHNKKKKAEFKRNVAVVEQRRDQRIRLRELKAQGVDVTVPPPTPHIVSISDETERGFRELQSEANKMKRIIEQLEQAEKQTTSLQRGDQ